MLGSAGWSGTMLFLVAQLLFSGACSRNWTSVLPNSPIAKAAVAEEGTAHEPGFRSTDPFIAYRRPTAGARPERPSRLPNTTETVLAFDQRDCEPGSASGSTRSDDLQLTGGYWGSDETAIVPADDSLLSRPSKPFAGERFTQVRTRARKRLREARYKIRADHGNYYSWLTMRDLLLGVSMGSVLANTSMDQDIQDWYQEDVRDSGTDDFASFCKVFGEGQIFISSFAAMALADGFFDIEEGRPGYQVGQFADRVTRGYLVGSPPMLFMQACLGGSRPDEQTYESRWQPFADNNAVSGHAFVGAMPFLTAGRMLEQHDRPYMAGCLYFCSTLPAWSRVNDDAHYFSQACLGWWMAYLACRAVNDTEQEYRHLTLSPLAMNDTVGIQAVFER